MKICGVDIKGNEAIITIIETRGKTLSFINATTKKISLTEDYLPDLLRSFKRSFNAFLNDNDIENVILYKKAKSGMYSGSSLSFKIECLIQLNEKCPVCFIPPATVRAMIKKRPIKYPEDLNIYQQHSFDVVFAFINKDK